VETDGAIDTGAVSLGPGLRIYSLNVEQITCIKLQFIYSGIHSHSSALQPHGKATAVTIGEETERAKEQVCMIQKSKSIFRVSQPVAHIQY
jgi:hypothetical protein